MKKPKLLAFSIAGDCIDEVTFNRLPLEIQRVILLKLRHLLEPNFAAKLAK